MINLMMTVAVAATAPLAQPENLTHIAADTAGVTAQNVNKGWMKVRTTAYTHTEADHTKYGRKTALGTTLKYGKIRSVASDWSKFPVGTKFKIKGDPNLYQIDDYGSGLVGKTTLDLYKPSRSSMNSWGSRYVEIQVVEWGCFDRSLKIMSPRTHNKHVRRMVQSLRDRKD